MSWFIWAIVLMLQQGTSTASSRAKNSNNMKYAAVAATFGNGVWFCSQIVVVTKITEAFRSNNWSLLLLTGVFYTTFCVLGTVLAQWFLVKHVEKVLKHATPVAG